eukprot:6478-Heterococcus_DN1.PRE.1
MDDSDALQQRAYGAATIICTNQKVSFGTLFALYTRSFITKRITSAYAHALSVVLVAYETRGAQAPTQPCPCHMHNIFRLRTVIYSHAKM